MTSVGFWILSTTFAMVKVLPEPVTPRRTWCLLPFRRPSHSFSMACGWSPVGLKSDTILNFGMTKYYSLSKGVSVKLSSDHASLRLLPDQDEEQDNKAYEHRGSGLVLGILFYHVEAPAVLPFARIRREARKVIRHCLVILRPCFSEATDKLLVLLPLLVRSVINEEPDKTADHDPGIHCHAAVPDGDEERPDI